MNDPMFQKVRDTVRAGLPPRTDVIFYYNKHVALYQMKIMVLKPCSWFSELAKSNLHDALHAIGADCKFDYRNRRPHSALNIKFIIVVEWRPK